MSKPTFMRLPNLLVVTKNQKGLAAILKIQHGCHKAQFLM